MDRPPSHPPEASPEGIPPLPQELRNALGHPGFNPEIDKHLSEILVEYLASAYAAYCQHASDTSLRPRTTAHAIVFATQLRNTLSLHTLPEEVLIFAKEQLHKIHSYLMQYRTVLEDAPDALRQYPTLEERQQFSAALCNIIDTLCVPQHS